MKLQFVENDLYDIDDDDEPCPNCFNFGFGASSTMSCGGSGGSGGGRGGCSSKTQKRETLNANFKSHQQQQQHNRQQHQKTITPTQTSTSTNHRQQQQQQNLLTSKDLIGNSKEFRIENNKCNLRIIGNGNRIRISFNTGNLQIIGNNTRLRIKKNNGNIKYTGNEGRICLGSESIQQTVDYIGCNGLLKVVNSMELNKSPCNKKTTPTTTKNIHDKVNSNNNNSGQINFPGNATNGNSPNSSSSSPRMTSIPIVTSSRVKSASCDSIDDTKNMKWQHFNELLQQENLQHFTKVSLPNLKENFNTKCSCNLKSKQTSNKKNFNDANNNNNSSGNNNSSNNSSSSKTNTKGIHISNNTNIVNNFGDIVIQNSVNVTIA